MVYFTPTVGEFRPGRNTTMTSPTKPTDTLPRVFRGGSWNSSSASLVRAACRFDFSPSIRNNYIGFRCAQRGCRQQVLEA